LTSYYIDNTGLYDSNGKTLLNPSRDQLLQYMLSDNPRQNKLMYDLDACVASIIHFCLTEEQAKELHEKERVNAGFCKLTYFPNRFFSIDGYAHYVNFGNMTRYKSDVHYSPTDIIEDKINKAKEAEQMAIGASDILKSIDLDPQKIISPITALIDKYIRPLAIPTVDDYPLEVGELAYQSIKGNWNECYQMGHWDNALDYDINGAYGSRLAKLLDIRRGTWEKSDSIPDKAVYGFADGILNINADSFFHPYMVKVSEDFSYTPTGSRPDQLPLNLIKLLYKHKMGTYHIKKGYWWIPNEARSLYEPLKGIVNHLWNIRSKSEGLKKAIIRSLLAAIWGKMTEIHKDEFGKLFNPVWGSIVENDVKYIVADTCLSAGITPLQIAVDGVLTDKPLPIQDTKELGGWRLSHKGKALIVSSGVIAMEGKDGAEEFALKYDWLYNKICNEPYKSEFVMNKYSPVTLGKALKTAGFSTIGELQDINRSVIIGKDYKRMYNKYPLNGSDLLNNKYKSAPIDYTMINTIPIDNQ